MSGYLLLQKSFSFGDDEDPEIRLRDGLDVQKLRGGEQCVFEVDEEDMKKGEMSRNNQRLISLTNI